MLNLSRLRPLIRNAWGPDTCDPVDLADWRPDNPARGQCGVTALVVQDLLGGALILGEVHVGGERRGYHYWNRLPDGTEVDLTRDQFRPEETVTAGVPVDRPVRSPRRCRGQYELLRHRVLTQLGDSAPPAGQPVRIALVLLAAADDDANAAADDDADAAADDDADAAAGVDADAAAGVDADAEGAVLLQLRGEDVQAEPGQWSLPGGHVEDGEEPEQAARRELAEETGLVPAGELRPFWQGVIPDLTGGASAVEVHVFTGRYDSLDATGGEGQQLAAVPLADVTTFDLSPTAARVLSRRLADRRG